MNLPFACDGTSNRMWRSAVFALVSVAVIASATVATAQVQCDECSMCNSCINCCHELPELWLMSTRHMPRCSNLDASFECLSVRRYDRKCGRFVNSSIDEFLACEATMPTIFYLHGNSLTGERAMGGFWDFYEKMRCCPGKKRLVCWSWPSERVYKTEGLRVRDMIQKNLRIKYVYAEYQGYYLAKLVERMSLSQRVMLSGHSYGAISTSVALHLLGGGTIRGLALESGAPVERANLRSTLISGAFDNDMLYPGHRYGQAFVAAEKIFVTHNYEDKTLRRWPDTSWTGRQAIGLTGMNAACLGEYRSKLCQMNTYPENARSHYLGPHLNNKRFMSALCCLSFGNSQPQVMAAAEKQIEAATPTEVAANRELSQPQSGFPAELDEQPDTNQVEVAHSENEGAMEGEDAKESGKPRVMKTAAISNSAMMNRRAPPTRNQGTAGRLVSSKLRPQRQGR